MPVPSQAQSHRRYPLTTMLGSAGNVRILRALAAGAAPLSAPQLAALAGVTPQGARLVLDALARQRLLRVQGSARVQLYALDRAHPLADSLVAVFREEARLWEALLESIRAALGRHGAAVSAAWLYGSVARGEDSPASDLDLAAVVRSRAVADRLREDLMPLEDEHQIRISLAALTPRELAALADDDPWWSGVVRDARVLKGAAPAQARRRLAEVAA